tara:strand:+ start:4784 stop:5179 length:396 start_codon:yes stop_codon:yes gene_type:complete
MNHFYNLPIDLQDFIFKKAHNILMSNVIKVIKCNSTKFVLRTRWVGDGANYPPQRWVTDNGSQIHGVLLEEIPLHGLTGWVNLFDILRLDSPIFDFKYKSKSEMIDLLKFNNVKVYKSWTKARMVKAWIKI